VRRKTLVSSGALLSRGQTLVCCLLAFSALIAKTREAADLLCLRTHYISMNYQSITLCHQPREHKANTHSAQTDVQSHEPAQPLQRDNSLNLIQASPGPGHDGKHKSHTPPPLPAHIHRPQQSTNDAQGLGRGQQRRALGQHPCDRFATAVAARSLPLHHPTQAPRTLEGRSDLCPHCPGLGIPPAAASSLCDSPGATRHAAAVIGAVPRTVGTTEATEWRRVSRAPVGGPWRRQAFLRCLLLGWRRRRGWQWRCHVDDGRWGGRAVYAEGDVGGPGAGTVFVDGAAAVFAACVLRRDLCGGGTGVSRASVLGGCV